VASTCHPKLLGRLKSGGSWFQASPDKKSFQDPHLKRKKAVVACICHPSEGGTPKIGRLWSRLAWVKKARLYIQNNQRKRGWRSSSSSKALSSNPSNIKIIIIYRKQKTL
jgi:hypothetical protein